MNALTWQDSGRDETSSSDGRFIAYGYADDDRMRYAVEDTRTQTQHDYLFPNMRAAQQHAEGIVADEMAQ